MSAGLSFRKRCLSAAEVCSEANVGQILPVDSAVGHLVSQIHHLSNLEVKKFYPKFCFFSGEKSISFYWTWRWP